VLALIGGFDHHLNLANHPAAHPMQPADLPYPDWLRQHPARWAPGTLDRAALHARASALAAEPGFDAEARHFAQCWQAAYDSSPALHTVMRNTPRYLLLVASLRLDHVRGSGTGGGVTPGQLIELLTAGGRQLASASVSRVKAILGHARAHGLLRPVPGAGDARRRPLEPTALLRDAMAVWVTGFLRGLPPYLPLPASPETMVALPGFVGELFTYRLAGFVEDHYILSEGVPELRWIMDREKGYHLFLSLVRPMQIETDGSATTQVVQSAMAAQARVSRGTVQNFLHGCQLQGWLQPGATVTEQRMSPAFTAAAMQWIALEFVWMHGLAVAAWHRLQAEPAHLQPVQSGIVLGSPPV